jgi:hypothetical protein
MARLNRKRKSTKNKVIAVILMAQIMITSFAVGSMIGYSIELSSIQKIIINSKDIPSSLKQKLTNYKINYLGGK